jgi:TonB-linked SusC/RagA family outer membrane protein
MYKNFTAFICGKERCCLYKPVLIMKLTFLLLTATFLQVTAATYAQKVTLNVKNASIKEVFERIQSQTNYDFLYNAEDLKLARPVDIALKNASLKEVLDKCFNNQSLTYSVENTTILIKRRPLPDTEKFVKKSITGTVTDNRNLPIPGVTVKEKNTAATTITDKDGNYTITVTDESSVLIFSSIGFAPQEVTVGNKSSINLTLLENVSSLNDVVVVGYGTQKKSDVTGAVVSANLDDFRDAPNTNIAQSLQGTVPGLNIGQVNSAGATPSIQVRGATTVNGNTNVLIVLDGIIYNGDLASINPDDIASIDVLKDASSTAIYGAQAANGVMLITTRKGKAGETRISYTGAYTTQTPNVSFRPQNRQQFLDKIRDLNYEKAYLPPNYTTPNPAYKLADDVLAVLPGAVDANGNITSNDFDWWGAATNPGHIQDHQLSISGGTDKINYLVSAGKTDQVGFIINDKFARNSIRLNLELKATDWLTLGVQSFGSFNKYDGDEPALSAIIRHSPLLVPYDSNGALIPYPTNTVLANPFLTYDVDDLERKNTFFGNFYAQVNFPFIKGLSYRVNYGNNYRVEKNYQASKYGAGLTGSASRNDEEYYDYTLDNILTYSKNFNNVHDINLTLLYSAIERQESTTIASATDFSSMTLGYNSLEQGTNQTASSDAWSEALSSQMARLNYKLYNRYLVTATIRRDGFSGFAQNEKWGLFPSAAIGWIVSEEGFFKSSWIDMLKIRASYGVNGNMIERYSSLARFTRGRRYIFGDGGSPVFGQQVESLANNELKWEKTTGLNLGIDFNLFHSRLTGALDIYNNVTNDLLFDVSLPGVIGIDEVTTNIGQLNNRGIELALTSQNIVSGNFKWSTTFNISSNRNKINSLVGLDANKDGVEDDLVQDNLYIGKSVGTFRGYQSNGLYQIADQINGQIPAGYYPGTFRIVDQNGDGVISAADQVILGRTEPAYRFGVLNTFSYKNFTLRAFVNSVQGGKNGYMGSAVNDINSVLSDNSMRLNFFPIDNWSPTNPNAQYARSKVGPATAPTLYRSRSFVRLQDVSLSYKFSGAFIKKLKLQNLSIYVSGKNLATWTDWPGWDPETGQGITDGGRPVMRGYSFGLNITL